MRAAGRPVLALIVLLLTVGCASEGQEVPTVSAPTLTETRARVPQLLEQAVAAFDIPPESTILLDPLEDSCDDTSLPDGAELIRLTRSTSLLLPGEQAQAQVDAARATLERAGLSSELTADGRAVRLFTSDDYAIILDIIPNDDRILVSISAPCATP